MQVVKLDDASAGERAENAKYLRDMADDVEAGEITEFVVAANHRDDQCFSSFANFDDRWRILGALEYVKQSLVQGGG
ncbi:hypothetical protein HME9302_00965 [Alteripontixanthobacter maritimus]|uniref:Uncharacterized protein n=1 Tax=Alteripontixanthobacter maritimus TaxID=2161824 RepID=A0A369Q5R8_9SPHN|nr:hypothetical protein [Alteripontixanthobacter maritimus]RDC59770.1 hypothetical protein HME9302_00965 [Alteripontixanthobacter maritimus]